jgi:copper chaperone CopZ
MSEYQLDVSGMKCEGCVTAVQDALRNVSGVEHVDVSLAEHTATVRGEVAVEDLIRAVHRAGYDAAARD